MTITESAVFIPTDYDADLSEDEYVAILRADMEGDERATDWLMHDVDEWFQGLVRLTQSVDAQLSARRAKAQEFQNECRRHGPGGRDPWFEYEQDYQKWRGSAVSFKSRVVNRQREVKLIRDKQAHERHNRTAEHGARRDNPMILPVLEEILATLQRIEKRLEDD